MKVRLMVELRSKCFFALGHILGTTFNHEKRDELRNKVKDIEEYIEYLHSKVRKLEKLVSADFDSDASARSSSGYNRDSDKICT